MLHRFTPRTVLGSAGVMGLLFVSKMSAVLIVPMGVLLIRHSADRIGRRWGWAGGGSGGQVAGRLRQLGLFLGAVGVHALVVVLVIWAFYGFRYSAIRPGLAGREQLDADWQKVLAKPFPMQGRSSSSATTACCQRPILFGQGYVLKYSQGRLGLRTAATTLLRLVVVLPVLFPDQDAAVVVCGLGPGGRGGGDRLAAGADQAEGDPCGQVWPRGRVSIARRRCGCCLGCTGRRRSSARSTSATGTSCRRIRCCSSCAGGRCGCFAGVGGVCWGGCWG